MFVFVGGPHSQEREGERRRKDEEKEQGAAKREQGGA